MTNTDKNDELLHIADLACAIASKMQDFEMLSYYSASGENRSEAALCSAKALLKVIAQKASAVSDKEREKQIITTLIEETLGEV